MGNGHRDLRVTATTSLTGIILRSIQCLRFVGLWLRFREVLAKEMYFSCFMLSGTIYLSSAAEGSFIPSTTSDSLRNWPWPQSGPPAVLGVTSRPWFFSLSFVKERKNVRKSQTCLDDSHPYHSSEALRNKLL